MLSGVGGTLILLILITAVTNAREGECRLLHTFLYRAGDPPDAWEARGEVSDERFPNIISLHDTIARHALP